MFVRPGAHLDLPSFPTRRSSDLFALGEAGVAAVRAALVTNARQPVGVDGQTEQLVLVGFERGGQLQRSEEHTSELQSRENLVCRLLLEKKKLVCTFYVHPHTHRR